MIDTSDFICGTYIYIHTLYMLIRYLAYMPNLVGIFVLGNYFSITFEVDITVGCVVVHIYAKISGLHAHIAWWT